MQNIGLFGGTFDPIHTGHLHIARAFADEISLDNVVFLPAGDPYHKHAARTAATHRLAMTELACRSDSRFAVSDCDIVRQGATYTYDTVQIFRQHFPQAQLHWLMGMDSLMQLHTWKNWQSLVRQVNIAVAARSGDTLARAPKELHQWLGDALKHGSLRLLNAPVADISSTAIRQALAEGKSADAQLLPEVAAYIRRHGLYRSSEAA